MIPLPRAWPLSAAMLIGAAAGVVLGVAVTLLVHASMRPDAAIAVVLGAPTILGMALIMTSGRRWVTALGAFVAAIAPGWFAALVLIQVVHGA
ncbi:putative holin [Mycolicibacterium confluentis]|nr:putative holin [Mycolicibacterium confluentis]MCV7320425.1 putative holin [Mycolicibacterium confluentis]